MKKLMLKNSQDKVIRSFDLQADEVSVVQRKDTKRIELVANTDILTQNKIAFIDMGKVRREQLEKGPVFIASVGNLSFIESDSDLIRNEKPSKESQKLWYAIVLLLLLLNVGFLTFIFNIPKHNAKLEEELKQTVVKIMKRIPAKPQPQVNQVQTQDKEVQPKKVAQKVDAIKRKGALAVLGSLSNSKQRGGLNLGAVNTTAGPGLGGTAGSGGVQTSLYGKGLVAAPLGAGHNMQGGGGYGTKGKGGGQAGYGKLSLVGSAGNNAIPLGKEAIIAGGLDRDLIADVIMRNMGQLRFCYEQALQGDPALAGRVAVEFTIGGNGQVRAANVENTTLNSKLAEDCMVLRLKTWKFPLPEGGVDVKVSYPFVFRRTGNG